MTHNEFKDVILPFIDLYWERTKYFNWPKSQQIRLGQMILFCHQTFIPDDVIVVDNNDDIIDGFHVCGQNLWKGEIIKNKLEELGVWRDVEE